MLSSTAKCLFIGMWNFCDDDGRMEFSPLRIKLQILPLDSSDLSGEIGELRGSGLITIYDVGSKKYLQVGNFHKHQKVDKRTPSKFPPPPPNPPELLRIPPTEGNGRDKKEPIQEEERSNRYSVGGETTQKNCDTYNPFGESL